MATANENSMGKAQSLEETQVADDETKEEAKEESLDIQLPAKRKRGRPRRGEVRPPPEEKDPAASSKRVKQALTKVQNGVPDQLLSSYKHGVLATYDEVHSNLAVAYRDGVDARTVDLSQVVKPEQENPEEQPSQESEVSSLKEGMVYGDLLGNIDRLLDEIRDILELDADEFVSEGE